jgi:hypothetical protein
MQQQHRLQTSTKVANNYNGCKQQQRPQNRDANRSTPACLVESSPRGIALTRRVGYKSLQRNMAENQVVPSCHGLEAVTFFPRHVPFMASQQASQPASQPASKPAIKPASQPIRLGFRKLSVVEYCQNGFNWDPMNILLNIS